MDLSQHRRQAREIIQEALAAEIITGLTTHPYGATAPGAGGPRAAPRVRGGAAPAGAHPAAGIQQPTMCTELTIQPTTALTIHAKQGSQAWLACSLNPCCVRYV